MIRLGLEPGVEAAGEVEVKAVGEEEVGVRDTRDSVVDGLIRGRARPVSVGDENGCRTLINDELGHLAVQE